MIRNNTASHTHARPLAMNKTLLRACASLCAMLLLLPAPALAQDDDMPDGDVDIVEKPKKTAPKKAEPKREEKKAEPKKEEKKPEPKPEPKDDKKDGRSGRKPIGSDDDVDDILTVPASAVPPPVKATPPPPPPADPALVDDAAPAGGGRVLVGGDDDVPEPPPSSRLLDEDPPAKPLVAPVDTSDGQPVKVEGERSTTTEIETTVEEPEEPAGSTPWIVAGAVGGGVVLAGVVGGVVLLVGALTATPSGTVTVTPH